MVADYLHSCAHDYCSLKGLVDFWVFYVHCALKMTPWHETDLGFLCHLLLEDEVCSLFSLSLVLLVCFGSFWTPLASFHPQSADFGKILAAELPPVGGVMAHLVLYFHLVGEFLAEQMVFVRK